MMVPREWTLSDGAIRVGGRSECRTNVEQVDRQPSCGVTITGSARWCGRASQGSEGSQGPTVPGPAAPHRLARCPAAPPFSPVRGYAWTLPRPAAHLNQGNTIPNSLNDTTVLH